MQFVGPVEQQWKDAVTAAGGELHDYIPDFAFIVRLDATSKDSVSQLPFVRWVGAFQPAYKLSHEAMGLAAQSKAQRLTLNVLAFSGSNDGVVNTLPGVKLMSRSVNSFDVVLRIELDSNYLVNLAQLDAVSWIEQYHEPVVYNDQMRGVTGVNQLWANGTTLYGQGQTVAVADTGLDTGSTSSLSPDFSGRLDHVYALGRTNDWSDPDGHGTHVAGTVLGNGVRSGSNPSTHSYTTSFAGMAPEAHLDFQSIMDAGGGLGGIPADLNTLFQQVYDVGARIHTNSWGANLDGEYDTMAQEVDQFTWNHPDMTILYAAGNSGVDNDSNGVIDLGSVGSPASAKNDITVGASENNRPPNGGACEAAATGLANCQWGQFTWGGGVVYSAAPISGDYISDHTNGMAAFSSRGPDLDGRIEPSISNAGTNVISVRSQDPSDTGTGWGLYNQYYLYDGGTSMATPGSAGAAALTRQYLARLGYSDPLASLIKATMMNIATDMAPGQYGTGATQEMGARPNNVEGWGRINLLNALDPPASIHETFNQNLSLNTGTTTNLAYYVSAAGHSLHITLAWSDYPGTPDAASELVNDLDLTVIGPGGTYHGNGVSTGDRVNNVESVDLSSAPVGNYTIRITGHNVPHGPQPASLVVWGAALPGGGPTNTPAPPSPTPPCAVPFVDIQGNIFYQSIVHLYCSHVVSGTDSTHFSPAGTSTRGQFAKVIVLGFGIANYTPSGGQDFSDVAPSYFAYAYIEAGYHAGVLSGFDATTCANSGAIYPCYIPNRAITRGQITKLVVNAAGYALYTPTGGAQTFSDVPPSNIFYASIETAHHKGVINGYTDGTFLPNANVRRDAMSQIVYKAITTP